MSNRSYMLYLLLWLFGFATTAAAFNADECRPVSIVEGEYYGPGEFDRGLLWKIEKPGSKPSYIFGTIHVSDKEILALPEQVEQTLKNSDQFFMEVLPDPGDAAATASLMFFNDGKSLRNLVSPALFNRVSEILSVYRLPEVTVSIMKPWAAFMTMSYPPNSGQILDLKLLELARTYNVKAAGLENLEDQLNIFTGMTLQEQLLLLTDTTCHHDMIKKDFENMKALYLQRDLKGLYLYGQRYAFEDNSIYEKMTDAILTKRNYTMIKTMQPALQQGGAFIAVGALHLPGEEGILALLKNQAYKISKIY